MPKDNVEIYRRIDGKKFESWAAHLDPVQAALGEKALVFGVKAEAHLLEHRHSGHSRIEVAKIPGRTPDWAVYLDDTGDHFDNGEYNSEAERRRSQKARLSKAGAMSIQTGRKPSERDRGMKGLDILPETMKGVLRHT